MWEQWWEIAKAGSPVAIFVMGIAGGVLWKTYQAELSNSRERERQTMTALMDLTGVVKNIESQEGELLRLQAKSTESMQESVSHSTEKLVSTMEKMAEMIRHQKEENSKEFQKVREAIHSLKNGR